MANMDLGFVPIGEWSDDMISQMFRAATTRAHKGMTLTDEQEHALYNEAPDVLRERDTLETFLTEISAAFDLDADALRHMASRALAR